MTDKLFWRVVGVVAVFAGLIAVALMPFLVPGLTQPQTQYLAGVMVLSAGVLAFYGTHLTRLTTERNNLREHHRERESNLHERFTAAAKQLSDAKSGVRQAGAYALSALANDWYRHGTDTGDLATGKAERQVCIDILCAYLRGPADSKDIEVRKTIIGLLRSFTLLGERHRPSWAGQEFNLSGADLKGAELAHANLSGVNLTDADLSMSNFMRANLTGANFAKATMKGAVLTGASLSRSDLSAADLSEAQLAEADLADAIWTSGTKWPEGYEPPRRHGQNGL